MRRHDRQERLIRVLEAERTCGVGDLAARLGVSEETVRRDVKELEAEGKVHKLHGAVRLPDNAFETPFDMRVNEHSAAKAAIASATAQLIADNSTVFLDSGSTTLHVARALRGHRQLSVVTNAIDAAHALTSINNNRVFLAGGEIDQDYRAVFGAAAEAFLALFVPDVAVLSIGAIDPERGLMDFHLGEATIKRRIAEQARSVILVADSSKFERLGLVQTCSCDRIDTFVTNAPVPEAFRERFPDVRIVDVSRDGRSV